MRILIVSSIYPPVVRGGYEVECRDVVEHLRARHEVHILTSDHRLSECPPNDRVLRVLPFADEERAEVLRAPFIAPHAVRTTRRILSKIRPDLIFVWNGSGLPHAALHALHRSGHPIAYRICEHWFGHLYDDDLFMRFLLPGQRAHKAVWATFVRAVNRHPALRIGDHEPVDVAICWNSEYLRAAVPVPRVLHRVFEDVVHPINAAAGAMADVPRRPPKGRPVVLYVGRVSPDKGVDVAIRALARLQHDLGRWAALRIVGDGPTEWRRKLETLAETEGVAARVSFAGPLYGSALHAEVAAASAWVVPSVWDEPAPMVAVEAGLARVPVVASRVGGIPELLRDPVEALLFERGDASACAAALAETLGGGSRVSERVRRAHIRARELSFGPYLEKMDNFLNEAALALQVRT